MLSCPWGRETVPYAGAGSASPELRGEEKAIRHSCQAVQTTHQVDSTGWPFVYRIDEAMPAGRVKTPLSANEGPSAKLKDEQMQRLIQGALGAGELNCFIWRPMKLLEGTPL